MLKALSARQYGVLGPQREGVLGGSVPVFGLPCRSSRPVQEACGAPIVRARLEQGRIVARSKW